MDPNENVNAPQDETPVTPPTPQRKKPEPAPGFKKKAKKTATPTRTVEDLETTPTSRMTDIEKDVYISYLRAKLTQKEAQFKNLDDTARKVFERGAKAEQAYNDFKTQVDRDMSLIRSGVTILAESIINHTYGGK